MTNAELLAALLSAANVREFELAVEKFEEAHGGAVRWVPVGRENNRGTIEAASDPGRSLVERLTNGIDAVLELEHGEHKGVPDCKSPKEAAAAWLAVPSGGLSEMSQAARQALAQRVTVGLQPGEGKESRIVEVRDRGTGLSPARMPTTILSLSETNKSSKLYLAGAYGQGGSSTFVVSKATLIASRTAADSNVGFTIVRFHETPPEEFKTGQYVYLTLDGKLPEVPLSVGEFAAGTLVRHVGFDLSHYGSPLGPNSVYGLLNQVLFDPVMPVWLDAKAVHGYRRVIKGSRNALNGAVDEGDDAKESKLSHNMPLFRVDLGEYGRIGLEYWVLQDPTTDKKEKESDKKDKDKDKEKKKSTRPTAAFVNPNKPIVLTSLGQNQGEQPLSLIKKDADLSFLAYRLIVHVDCNALTNGAKRLLFVSNREDARRGAVLDMIRQEVVKALKSDEKLEELNALARANMMRNRDEVEEKVLKTEVARLLRVLGGGASATVGTTPGGTDPGPPTPRPPPPPRPPKPPIETKEPPTFISIKWEAGKAIPFHPEQRRYLRVETDANSTYHNPNDPSASRINIIVSDAQNRAESAENAKVVEQRLAALDQGLQSMKHKPLSLRGTTPLQGGRMRFIVEGDVAAEVGATGKIRIELSRPGLPTLSDERDYIVVSKPPVRAASRGVAPPDFNVVPVDGPTDPKWSTLGWGESEKVASSAQMDGPTLVIFYNTQYPKFAEQRAALERRDPALAISFTKRYEIWLAVHSLIFHQDQQAAEPEKTPAEDDTETLDREREERTRIAKLAAMFASREVELPSATPESE